MRVRGSRSIPEQENILEDPSNQDEVLNKTTAGRETGVRRIHRKLSKPLRVIIVILAVVFAVFIFFNIVQKPYDRSMNEYKSVAIEAGDDIDLAAERLEQEGIVGSASRFSLVARMMLQTDVKPGTYYLSPSMDSVSIAKAICKGNVTLDGFIIPKGFTLDQTITSLSRDGFGDKDAFLRAASDPSLQELDFIGTDVKGFNQVEGFLMPGTYRLDSEADEMMIIMTMLDSFGNFFNDDYRARADELGLSIRDIIVIASMIEKETSIDSERAGISSVIHNRINLGMISAKDFPEIPLCSPGEESIIAALYPDDNENIYYVLDSKLDGTHVFASDETEYEELKAAYEEALAAREEKKNLRQQETDEESQNDESAEEGDEN